MIVPTMGRVGETLTFEGYAYEFDLTRIVALEFSMDDGETWTRRDVSDTTPERWVRWTFSFTPEQPGHHRLIVRAVDELGRANPEPEYADIYVE